MRRDWRQIQHDTLRRRRMNIVIVVIQIIVTWNKQYQILIPV